MGIMLYLCKVQILPPKLMAFKSSSLTEREKWRDNIAVNRFIDRILDKIVKDTGFNINEL